MTRSEDLPLNAVQYHTQDTKEGVGLTPYAGDTVIVFQSLMTRQKSNSCFNFIRKEKRESYFYFILWFLQNMKRNHLFFFSLNFRVRTLFGWIQGFQHFGDFAISCFFSQKSVDMEFLSRREEGKKINKKSKEQNIFLFFFFF